MTITNEQLEELIVAMRNNFADLLAEIRRLQEIAFNPHVKTEEQLKQRNAVLERALLNASQHIRDTSKYPHVTNAVAIRDLWVEQAEAELVREKE